MKDLSFKLVVRLKLLCSKFSFDLWEILTHEIWNQMSWVFSILSFYLFIKFLTEFWKSLFIILNVFSYCLLFEHSIGFLLNWNIECKEIFLKHGEVFIKLLFEFCFKEFKGFIKRFLIFCLTNISPGILNIRYGSFIDSICIRHY